MRNLTIRFILSLLLFTFFQSLHSQDCPIIDASSMKLACYKTESCPGAMTGYGFNPPQTSWAITGGSFQAVGGNPANCAQLNKNNGTLTHSGKNCGIGNISFDVASKGGAGTFNFAVEIDNGNGWYRVGSGSISSATYYLFTVSGINVYGNGVKVRVRATSRTSTLINLYIDNFSITDYSLNATLTEPGCNVCAGEQVSLWAEASGLKVDEQIEWFESSTNPPYPGGINVGNSPINTIEIPADEQEPGDECPKLVSIFIDACDGSGVEQDNEFVVLTSGSGFSVPNFSLDLPNNNGAGDGDIGQGNPCPLQAPSAALWANVNDCANVISGNPAQNIPENAFVIVFTSVNENVNYDLSAICGLGYDIYIFQSSCARSQGAFVNGDGNGTRTTTASFSGIGCSNAITYDSDNPAIDPPTDGDMVYVDNTGGLVYANNGCTVPPLSNIQVPKVYRSEVIPFSYPATCSGTKYVQGVIRYGSCADVVTPVFSYNVICPVVTPRDTTICTGRSVDLRNMYMLSGGNADVNVTFHSGTPANSGNVLPSPIVSPALTTIYYIKADYAGKCNDTKPITVNISPPVNAMAGANPNPACVGKNLSLTSSGGTGYIWNGPNGFVSPAQNPMIGNITTLNQGVYTVTVTNAAGCTATASINVTVNASPSATASADMTQLCVGDNINLHSNGGATYAWSGPNGYSSLMRDPIINNAQSNHSGAYEVTVTNALGCSNTAVVNITVDQIPDAMAAVDSNNLCIGDVLSLTATGIGTYSWSGPNGFNSNNQNPLINNIGLNAAGDYILTVTSGICTDIDTIHVFVNPCNGCVDPPVVHVGNDTTICFNSPLVLNGFSSTGNGTWTTSTFDGSFSNVNDPNATYFPGLADRALLAAVLTYTSEDPDGPGPCEAASDAMKVIFLPAGSVSMSGSVSMCGFECRPIRFLAQGDQGPFEVVYKIGLGSIPLGQGYVGTFQQLDTIWFCFDGDSLRFDPVTHTVHIPYWYPPGSVTGTFGSVINSVNGCPQTISGTVNITLQETPTVDIIGNLEFCPGKRTTLAVVGSYPTIRWSNGGTTKTISAGTPGQYAVTVTNAGGCTAADTVQVTKLPDVSTAISGSSSFCSGSYTTLDAGGGFAQYSWTNGSHDRTINAAEPGLYVVTVTATTGCTATAAIIISEMDGLTINITGDTSICPNQLTTLAATGGFFGYEWSTGQLSQTIDVNQTGYYTVTVTDANGCTGTDDISVILKPDIAVAITGSRTFCLGGYTILDAGDYQSYSWSNGSQSKKIQVNVAGIYTVTVTSSQGCTGTGTINVTQGPGLTIAIQGNQKICIGESTMLDAGAGYQTYNWTTGVGVQVITVNAPGIYGVTVTDATGCIGTDTITVIQIPALKPKISGSATFCPGDSTTLDAGAGYANYEWSSGETTRTIIVNAPGFYEVSVNDANGCRGKDTITVYENNVLVFNIVGLSTLCAGQSTLLDAGPGFDSYIWSTGEATQTISTSSGGLYSVTVTSSQGCSGTDDIVITQSPPINVNINGSSTFCAGSSSQLDAGTGFVLYKWSDGSTNQKLTVNASGTFSVTVTDMNGCTGQDQITVTESNALTINIQGNTTLCSNETSTLDPGPGFATYTWSTGASTQTITVNSSGTFRVTVTDASGCSGTDDITITKGAPVSVNITGNNAICATKSTNLKASTGFASYIWSNGATTENITVNTGGTYTVTVTDANGCTGTDDFVVTQSPPVNVNIVGSITFCAGSTTTLDAGAGYSAYKWSDASIGQTLITGTPGTYSVTVTDANGCTGTNSITVTESNALSITIAGDQTLCQSQTTVLDPGTGFANYTWSNGAVTQTITVNSAGTYSVTVQDASGCSGTDEIIIAESPPINATITGMTQICTGNSTTLDAGAGYSSYLWSTGATTQTISVDTAGLYAVILTNADGCTGTASVRVTVSSTVTVAVVGNPKICFGKTTQLTADAGFTSYQWSNGMSTQVITVGNGGTYTVTVSDANGCSGTGQITVTAYPQVAVSLSGSTTYCVSGSTNLDAGNGFADYIWSTGAITPAITISSPGTYSVTVTDSNGCTNSTSVIVTESTSLSITISGKDKICTGEATTLSAGNGFKTYLWSSGEMTESITATGGNYTVTVTDNSGCTGTGTFTVTVLPDITINFNVQDTVCLDEVPFTLVASPFGGTFSGPGVTGTVFNPATAGVGVHQLIYTFDNGVCAKSDTTLIFVKDCACSLVITVSAGSDQNICEGDKIQLNGIVTGISNFTWSTSGTGTFSDNKMANPVYNPSLADMAAGSVTITLTTSDPDGAGPCQAVKDVLSLKLERLPQVVNLTVTQPTCLITTGLVSYTVNPVGSKFSVDNGSTFTTNSSIGNLKPGNYTLLVVSPTGCRITSGFTVNPPIFFNPDWHILSHTCADVGSNTFILDDASLMLPVSVYLNGALQGTFNSLPVTIDSLKFETYTLKIEDQTGCVKDSTFTFSNTGSLSIDIQDVYTIEEGQQVQLVPKINGTYSSILWTPPTGLSCADCPNPLASPEFTTLYQVEIFNAQGCKDQDTVRVIVTPRVKVFIPNIFTPNHDGTNDVFTVTTADRNVLIKEMRIFNRWGDQVYGGVNLVPNGEHGWDGYFKGKLMDPAVFAYLIVLEFPDKSTRQFKGSVTLIR